ncbi:MAG: hypothetical protein OEV44_10265, partial [Spirochaetota bacterium]|nr:hypothetical protein [Spirochaetota bacterium]
LIEKGFLKKISQFVGVIFGLHSFKKEFIVLKSGHNMMPHEITDVIKVEWLTGCCFWLKQNVFNEFQFEEKFVKWAYGEDKLLSYQIYKKYPNTLYYYPKAQLYHYESPKARLQGEEKIILKTIYHFWFFYKCINKNYFFFWWRNLGEFMLYFVSACLGKEFFINSWYYLKSNCILIKNLKIIKKGDFKQFIK